MHRLGGKSIVPRRKPEWARRLIRIFHLLDRALGPQHWWPGETPFEVIVGAILTQSTAWGNVEQAISNLKHEKKLNPEGISRLSTSKLARLIRPSGYYNQKAKRLKTFVFFLNRYGSLRNMFLQPTRILREALLSLHGIGPETADSILLYAGGHLVFVVDAYTRRIFVRHGWTHDQASYQDIQELFQAHLPRDVQLFNQYHALLVNVGKNHCKKGKPLCERCPLEPMLPRRSGNTTSGLSMGRSNGGRLGD